MARTVTAVDRAVQILDFVASSTEPCRVGPLARALGLPRNSAYELVRTLQTRSYLHVDTNGTLRLGSGLLALCGSTANSDFVSQARDYVRHLRDESQETVHLAVLDGRFVTYLLREDSPRPVRMVSAVGLRIPAHATGVGKVLLASLAPVELLARLRGVELERLTPRTITDLDTLMDELAEVRLRGYAVDSEESSPEVGCIASPIYRRNGDVVAAMSVAAPIHRMKSAERTRLGQLVMSTTTKLSQQLGYESTVTNPAPDPGRRTKPQPAGSRRPEARAVSHTGT